MADVPTSVRALREIDRLPVDFSEDILANYPLLKLGTRDSVDFYGAALMDLVREIVCEGQPDAGDWVLTGPAFNVLPGGPNLLCEHFVERLRFGRSSGVAVSHVPLGVETAHLEIRSRDALHKYHNYSTFTQEERQAAYRKTRRPVVDPAAFAGRSILFVNDIKVTGTQQVFMQDVFEEVAPRRICWLYILAVSPEIAASNPEVEYEINHSRYAGFEAFADLLVSTDLRYTSRCITRLLSYDTAQLEGLAVRLGRARVGEILDLAMNEGRFGGDLFRDKIALLERFAGRRAIALGRAVPSAALGSIAT